MADSTSSKSRNVVIAILVGLLVLAFALWGSEDVFNPQAQSTVLTIGEEEVSAQEFRRLYDQELRAYSLERGVNLTNEQALAQGIPSQILGQILSRKIMLVDATDLGIGYNARSARNELSKLDVFKDPITGEYSIDQLRTILATQNPPLSTEQYANLLVEDMRISQTRPAIVRGVQLPGEFAETFYNFILESREASVLTLSDKIIPPAPEPTDEQLKTFIAENINQFTAPEYRRVTMIRLEPHDFRLMDDNALIGLGSVDSAKAAHNNIFVTEGEIEAQYEVTVASDNLAKAAKRSLTVFTAENEETAKTIAEKLDEGLTAAEITTLLGLNDPTTYDDVESEAILDPNVAEAAFEMKEGDVQTLIGGFDRWVAVQVTAATEAFKPARATIEDEVVKTIFDINSQGVIYDKMDLVQREIEDGRSLEEAAELSKLPFSSMPFVDRFGSTPDELSLRGSNRLPGVATDDEILKFIFTANPEIEVDTFDTSTGGRAMIRVDAVIEQTPRTFEESKTRAILLWKQDYQETALDDLMQSLGDRVVDGESLEDVAADLAEGAIISDFTLTRTQQEQALGNQVWAGIIESEEGDVTRGFGPQTLTRQIAVLNKVVPNAEPIPATEQSLIQDRLTTEIVGDIMRAYQNSVTEDYPYSENQERVRQILGITANNQ